MRSDEKGLGKNEPSAIPSRSARCGWSREREFWPLGDWQVDSFILSEYPAILLQGCAAASSLCMGEQCPGGACGRHSPDLLLLPATTGHRSLLGLESFEDFKDPISDVVGYEPHVAH